MPTDSSQMQGTEPPYVGFLADARSKPKYADVMKFFGNKVYDNLQQRAQNRGKTHFRVAPFGREGSFWAVVYTDGTRTTQRSPLNSDGEWGMWFPTLVVRTCDGRWDAWCLAAAINNWKNAWEVHPSRLLLYVPRAQISHSPGMSRNSNHNTQNSGTAGSSTDPVSEVPGDHWTVLEETTVVIEEISTVLHGFHIP